MKVLSLFSGIGGLELGLERAGMTVVGQVEIDPFCRGVLAKHWPGVWRHDDVRTLTGEMVRANCGDVDLVCGGVPCQPASIAGKRKGAADERWLWGEWCRVVREVRPAWFLAENVRGWLTLRESRLVIGDLEGAGYEVRTLLLGARHVGAPHRRDRVWVVGRLADATLVGRERGGRARRGRAGLKDGRAGVADADSTRLERRRKLSICPQPQESVPSGICRWPARPGEPQHEWEEPRLLANPKLPSAEGLNLDGGAGPREAIRHGKGSGGEQGVGLAQPALGSDLDGLPRRLAGWRRAALQACGNAVVPQVAEVVGRAIMEAAK